MNWAEYNTQMNGVHSMDCYVILLVQTFWQLYLFVRSLYLNEHHEAPNFLTWKTVILTWKCLEFCIFNSGNACTINI